MADGAQDAAGSMVGEHELAPPGEEASLVDAVDDDRRPELAGLAGVAALVLVLGLVLPWSEGSDERLLSVVAYPGQALNFLLHPFLMLALAVAAATGRAWRAVSGAALVAAPWLLWTSGPALWETRDFVEVGPGYWALGIGYVLALVAVAVGLAGALGDLRSAAGAALPDPAEATAAVVGVVLLVVAWTRPRTDVTFGEETVGDGVQLRWELPDTSLLHQAAYAAAPLAVVGLVLAALVLGRLGRGLQPARRLQLWAGLAAGVGLDVLVRATSFGDASKADGYGIPGDPPTVAPALVGLLLAVGAAVGLLVAGWLVATAPPEDDGPATEPEDRA